MENKEQIEKIRELSSEGKKQVEIAQLIGCSQNTVKYWLMDETKRKEIIESQVEYFRNLSLEKRKEIYKKRLPYMKLYMRNRYSNDESFRKKEIERQKIARSKNEETRKD